MPGEPRELCGAPTKEGRPCRWSRKPCPAHGERQGQRQRQPSRPDESGRPPLRVPVAVRDEDPRALGWWIVARLIEGELEPQRATALTSLVRAIATLGPSPVSEREALAEIELRGLLMHGLPPRTADEWERAERILSAEALAEIVRRAELFDGVGGNAGA